MRKLSPSLAVFLLALAALGTAPVHGQSGNVTTPNVVQLHAGPSANARVLRTIPRGRTVRVANCARGWCPVRYENKWGYAAQSSLRPAAPPSLSLPPRQAPGYGYEDRRGQGRPSPRRSPDGRVPAGATARCKDGTYSQSRERSGTCSHHGGVKDWLN